jgi:hypothetical protein
MAELPMKLVENGRARILSREVVIERFLSSSVAVEATSSSRPFAVPVMACTAWSGLVSMRMELAPALGGRAVRFRPLKIVVSRRFFTAATSDGIPSSGHARARSRERKPSGQTSSPRHGAALCRASGRASSSVREK